MFQMIVKLFGGKGGGGEQPMIRCVVVDKTDTVINVVVLDRNTPEHERWECPSDCMLISHDEAGPGWILKDGKLIDPTPPSILPSPTVDPEEGMKSV